MLYIYKYIYSNIKISFLQTKKNIANKYIIFFCFFGFLIYLEEYSSKSFFKNI